MPKKEKTVENLIKDFEKDLLEEEKVIKSDSILEEYDVPTEEDLQREEAESHIENIPPDQGFYYKIYRKHPIPPEHKGKKMFLYQIDQPDLVTDLEGEVLKLAKKFGWCSGIYEVRLYQTAVSGYEKKGTFNLEVPREVPSSNGNGVAPIDPMESVKQAMLVIKELNSAMPQQNNGPQTNMGDIIKVVAEMYKANKTPTPTTPDPTATISAIATALKDLAPPQAQSGPDLLTVLKEVGVFNKPAATTPVVNPLDMLIKLKELMPAPPPPQDDMTKTLKMLTALEPFLNKMSGGDGNTSTAIELLRIIGPQLKDVVNDVTGTINNAIMSKQFRGKRRPPSMEQSATAQQTLPPAQQIPVENNLPVLQAVEQAARASNKEFFPQLEKLLEGIMTPEQLEQLLVGNINYKAVLEQISAFGGSFFMTPEAEKYFVDYITWAKDKKSSEVVGTCENCGIELVYESITEHEGDSYCPECQGNVNIGVAIPLPDNSPTIIEPTEDETVDKIDEHVEYGATKPEETEPEVIEE